MLFFKVQKLNKGGRMLPGLPPLKAKTFLGKNHYTIFARIVTNTSRQGKIICFRNYIYRHNIPNAPPPEEILVTEYIERPYIILAEEYLSQKDLEKKEIQDWEYLSGKIIFYPESGTSGDSNPKNTLISWLEKLYVRFNSKCTRLKGEKICDCPICCRGNLLDETIERISLKILGFSILKIKRTLKFADYCRIHYLFNRFIIGATLTTRHQAIIRIDPLPKEVKLNFIPNFKSQL